MLLLRAIYPRGLQTGAASDESARSLELGSKRIASWVVRHDTTLSFDAALKVFANVRDVLLGNRAPRQCNGRKKAEEKSHASHAKHTKKNRPAMATLIPPEELSEPLFRRLVPDGNGGRLDSLLFS